MPSIDLSTTLPVSREWREKLLAKGIDLSSCYQCGKCTAGCPMVFAMDYSPRQIVRLLQLGLVDTALRSRTIWLCASCETCSTRCPRDVDVAKLMDILRIESDCSGLAAFPNMPVFHKTFLESVEKHVRVYEMELMMKFNMRTKNPFNNAELGPKMMQKKKLHLFPPKVDDGGAVKKIFAKVRQKGVD
jgi:heterodisulfide reductase subunit C